MKPLLCKLLALVLVMLAGDCLAQQSQEFGKYSVHYNVINSNHIPAQVAQGYGITRSPNRALVNITVMDNSQGEAGVGMPVRAAVTTSAINLTGQRRDVEMREIVESEEAIYYIGLLPIHNMETYKFNVKVKPEGEQKPFDLSFRQQFYTE